MVVESTEVLYTHVPRYCKSSLVFCVCSLTVYLLLYYFCENFTVGFILRAEQ